MDAVLNLIPWGVGKTIKKFKNKVGRAIEGTDVYTTESYAEPFTPTITKKKGKSKVSKPSEEAENSETIRLARNRSKYEKELWNKQNGLCAISNIPMTYTFNSGRIPTNVSVDRIDSNKSYTKNNIQLVCMAVNQMKSDLDMITFYRFCEAILLNAKKFKH